MKEGKKSSAKNDKKQPLGRTPEESELRCIALASKLAEEQLEDGTASSQVITHYLKLGSPRARLEVERQRLENELLKAKTKALESAEANERLFSDAINAMMHYQGIDREQDSGDIYDE